MSMVRPPSSASHHTSTVLSAPPCTGRITCLSTAPVSLARRARGVGAASSSRPSGRGVGRGVPNIEVTVGGARVCRSRSNDLVSSRRTTTPRPCHSASFSTDS